MRWSAAACLAAVLLGLSSARPPQVAKGPGVQYHHGQPMQPEATEEEDWGLGVEYNKYLQEVVQVLESDPDFRSKLESAGADKIRDGSIASELNFVNHNVRNRLDEIKRQEVERLRHLAKKKFEHVQGIDRSRIKMPDHLHMENGHFAEEDLRKLIRSTTRDMEEADRKRRDEFKTYEMEKKFEQHERLNHIDDEEKRKDEEKRMKEAEEKHKKHDTPHHPMTKDQLEEVWEEQDHMRAEDWDPKTFFAMHDLNGDGHWDEDEVKVLFKKELDKVYDPNDKNDDMKERVEEMERMREHVFKESDTNRDKLISYDEFLAETKREEYNNDPGWDTMDQMNDPFSEEEFKEYEKQRQAEIKKMMEQGLVPPGYPYYGDIPPGAQPFNPHAEGMPYGAMAGHPQMAGQHPQMAGQHPQMAGQHPQMAGQQHPQMAGQHQQMAGQHPQMAGQHPQMVGQHQQMAGQHPQMAGQHPQMAGQHPQMAGQHPQAAGQHPQAAGQHPQMIGQQPNMVGQQHNMIGQQPNGNMVGQHPEMAQQAHQMAQQTHQMAQGQQQVRAGGQPNQMPNQPMQMGAPHPQAGQPQAGQPVQMGSHPQAGQPQPGHPQMGQPQMGGHPQAPQPVPQMQPGPGQPQQFSNFPAEGQPIQQPNQFASGQHQQPPPPPPPQPHRAAGGSQNQPPPPPQPRQQPVGGGPQQGVPQPRGGGPQVPVQTKP